MSEKMTFHFDRQGKSQHVQPVSEVQTVRETVRELASAYDIALPRSAGRAVRPLREVVFAALSVGVTLGALLIAFVHGIATSPPNQDTVSLLAKRLSITSAASSALAVTSNDHIYVPVAQAMDALVLPKFQSLMYEAGVFTHPKSALQARADYLASGIKTYLYSRNQAVLLLGPTVSAHGDPAFEKRLQQAEVPYYIRNLSTSEVTLPLTGISHADSSLVEQLVTADLQLLQGFIALRSGYAVPQLVRWDRERKDAYGRVQMLLISKLGGLGRAINDFDQSVRDAERQLQEAPGAGGVKAMESLAKAVAAYANIAGS